MPRPGLSPDVALGVTLDAICSRNRYTRTPLAVVDELLDAAGDRSNVLAKSVGIWAGFWEIDPYVRPLTVFLLEQIPEARAWAPLGRERRGVAAHGTHGFASHRNPIRDR